MRPIDLSARLELVEASAWAQIQRAVAPSFLERFGVSVHERDGMVALFAPLTRELALNRILALGVSTPLTAIALDALIAEYRAASVPRFLIGWSPVARPDQARQWFTDRGFRKICGMAKTYRRTGSTLAVDTQLEVTEVGAADAERFGATAARGNDMPPEFASGFNSTLGHPGWRHYLALDGARPVAAAALYVEGEVAWGGFAGTIASDRGRGAQSALLARRVRDAASSGAKWITCETTAESPERPNQSLRNMRRLGFELLHEREHYVLDLSDLTNLARSPVMP
jgi:hypothetical protein